MVCTLSQFGGLCAALSPNSRSVPVQRPFFSLPMRLGLTCLVRAYMAEGV
jgi:hypothetical protein